MGAAENIVEQIDHTLPRIINGGKIRLTHLDSEEREYIKDYYKSYKDLKLEEIHVIDALKHGEIYSLEITYIQRD